MTKHFLLKLLFLLPLSIGAFNSASAQIFVLQKNINEMKDIEHIEVNWLSANGITPRLSVGENIVRERLQDSKNRKLTFKTYAALCDYFYKNGWELVTNNCDVSCFSVFKRRKMPPTESNTEGAKTGL